MTTAIWDGVREIIDRAKRGLSDAVPDTLIPGEPEAVRFSRPLIRTVFDTWSNIEDQLRQAVPDIATLLADNRFVPEERNRQTAALVDTLRRDVEASMNTIDQAVTKLQTRLSGLARPARPQPADAAQEAALGNLRTDLRMVLDRTPTDELVNRLLDRVRTYTVEGDPLGLWLLASTDWPQMYLESRLGRDMADLHAVRFTAGLPQAHAAGDTEGVTAARRILNYVEGTKGLAGAVVAMRSITRHALDAATRGQTV